MDSQDIDNRFSFHPAKTEQRADDHAQVREECRRLAIRLNALLPEGREKALVITHLEDVMMWANAAIARQST